jgi:hypothetical protein
MADEITFSSLLANQAESEILSGLYLMALADRNALPAHPALFRVPGVAGRGSITQKIPQIGLMGYDLLASTGDGSAVANTALTDYSNTLAVARYSKSYESTDLARLVDAYGVLRPEVMAMDAVVSVASTLLSLHANLVDNFATTVGASGVDATLENVLDAITSLEINKVKGPFLGILHPVQWGDVRKDAALNAGGAIQWNAGSQQMLDAMKGLGYQGNFLGVDFFTSTHVPTANAGADRAGGIFGHGAIAYVLDSIEADPDLPQVSIGGEVLFEKSRTAKSGLTAYVSHAYMGASEQIDLCGVSVITDA